MRRLSEHEPLMRAMARYKQALAAFQQHLTGTTGMVGPKAVPGCEAADAPTSSERLHLDDGSVDIGSIDVGSVDTASVETGSVDVARPPLPSMHDVDFVLHQRTGTHAQATPPSDDDTLDAATETTSNHATMDDIDDIFASLC